MNMNSSETLCTSKEQLQDLTGNLSKLKDQFMSNNESSTQYVVHDSQSRPMNVEHCGPGGYVEQEASNPKSHVQQLYEGDHVEHMFSEEEKDEQINEEQAFSDTNSQFKYTSNEKGLDTQRFFATKKDSADGPAYMLS